MILFQGTDDELRTKMHFGANWAIRAKICDKFWCGQFPQIWGVKTAQMITKVHSNRIQLQYQLTVHQDACLKQILWP